MKKVFFFILTFYCIAAAAQVGVHTDFPDNSSAMDIVASNKGLLIPRVTLTSSLSNPSPVTSPAVGLMVFNSGANQPIGFYYWNGSSWVAISGGSGGSGNDWTLTGNSGTVPGTNFLGTTDNQHFVIYTNYSERMRFESDGQVIIGATTPSNATDLFTVFGNSTQNAAINAYSPRTGFQTNGGRYGILSTVDTASGFAYYGRNLDPLGYGMVSVGSNYTSVGLIASHTAGIHSQGYDGLHAWGKDANGYGIFSMGSAAASPFNLTGISAGLSAIGNYGIITKGTSTSGRGIVAIGSGMSLPSTSLESEGGAFTGFHGIYGKGNGYQTTPTLIAGIGVIGIGYNHSSYSALANGLSSGGSFSGDYGVYGKGLAATGVGVVGVGNNSIGYYTISNGSGGAFTGFHGSLSVGTDATLGTGVIGAGNNGSYIILPGGSGGSFTGVSTGSSSFGSSSSAGVGVIGAGNGQSAWVPSTGCGGAFNGNTGIFCRSSNPTSTGTGIVSVGNNLAAPNTFASGTGGAFTGVPAGVVAWGVDGTIGTGVIGAGNNIITPLTYSTGSGGAFTAVSAGSVNWATGASGTGVVGAGNNVSPATLTSGGGGAFTGNNNGAYGKATLANGTGVIGVGNNIATGTLYSTSGSGGAFTGTVCGVAGFATQAGATSYGVYGSYNGGGTNDGVGVYGYSYPNNNYGIGVYGLGRKYGVFASGGFGGTGAKYFVIDHPLDPENKILKHAAIESPEVLNMYRGNVVLNDAGEAVITLPDYFMEININYSYDLTPIGSPAPELHVKREIDETGTFMISGGNPDQKISWIVYAERNDLYMRQEGIRAVEIVKEDYEKGKYLMPELYGQPPEKGIYYVEPNGTVETTSGQVIQHEVMAAPVEKVDRVFRERTEGKSIVIESPTLKTFEDRTTPAEEILSGAK